MKWFQVYDFIEMTAQSIQLNENQKWEFIDSCNLLFKQELSGYRFVEDEIAQITSDEEIAEIEQAIENSRDVISSHLRRALELFSDKHNPDYRNSSRKA